MQDKIEATAKILEQGGAAVAVASSVGLIDYLDNHNRAILALCGIVGAAVSVIGLTLGWLYRHLEYKRGMKAGSNDIHP